MLKTIARKEVDKRVCLKNMTQCVCEFGWQNMEGDRDYIKNLIQV